MFNNDNPEIQIWDDKRLQFVNRIKIQKKKNRFSRIMKMGK